MKHNAITLCPVCVLFPREVEQAVIRRAGSSDIQIGTVSNTNGQMQERSMRIAGLEPGWLRRILQGQGIERDKDVLIATLDTQRSLLVQEKGDDGRLLTLDVLKPGQVRW